MKDQTEKKKKIKEAPIFYAVNYILLTIIALGCLVPFFNVVAKAFSTYGNKNQKLEFKSANSM